MVTMTQSMEHWLFENYKDIFALIMFGHLELFTEEMQKEYIEWCKTDEGKQYLKGGSKYDPEHKGNKALDEALGEQVRNTNKKEIYFMNFGEIDHGCLFLQLLSL